MNEDIQAVINGFLCSYPYDNKIVMHTIQLLHAAILCGILCTTEQGIK